MFPVATGLSVLGGCLDEIKSSLNFLWFRKCNSDGVSNCHTVVNAYKEILDRCGCVDGGMRKGFWDVIGGFSHVQNGWRGRFPASSIVKVCIVDNRAVILTILWARELPMV